MLNTGQTSEGTKINILETGSYILIHPDTIYSGTITVRNKSGVILWQAKECTAKDIPFAIEIATRNISTFISM